MWRQLPFFATVKDEVSEMTSTPVRHYSLTAALSSTYWLSWENKGQTIWEEFELIVLGSENCKLAQAAWAVVGCERNFRLPWQWSYSSVRATRGGKSSFRLLSVHIQQHGARLLSCEHSQLGCLMRASAAMCLNIRRPEFYKP